MTENYKKLIFENRSRAMGTICRESHFMGSILKNADS